jgi:LacI family transcriptional regulator
MSMGTSIIELSKVAGVSKSTVSRVLNQDPRVSAEAVEAVQRAVDQLGYSRPQHQVGRPRRMPNGIRKGTVVLLFPDVDPRAMRTVLSARLLHGVEEALRRKGMGLLITGLPGDGRMPQSIQQRQVDGVIVRGAPQFAAARTMIHEGIGKLPCVHLFEPRGAIPPTWDVVLEDNDVIAELAADYLYTRGRRNFAMINLLPEHPSLRHRGRAFRDAAEDRGATVHFFNEPGRSVSELVEAALAKYQGKLDGVFVPGSDDHVVEVYRALQAQGCRPVDDADFICCYNDPQRLSTLDPRLANLDIQPEAIGRAAAETLLWRLQNPKEPQRRLAIAPATTAPAPEDPLGPAPSMG